MPLHVEILVCRDRASLVQRGADLVRAGSLEAIATHGRAAVATSCGDVAAGVFEALEKPDFPWGQCHLFAANECAHGRGDRAPASRRTHDVLSRLPAPRQHLHAPPPGLTDPYGAASAYEQRMRAFFGIAGGALPCFDLIVLQLGEDGQAASLFPFSSGLDETARLAVANYSHEHGGHCVTFTAPLINQAHHVVLLASGAAVAPMLRDMVVGEFDPRRIPAQLINPVNGTLHLLADHEAAAAFQLAQRATRAAGGEHRTNLNLNERESR